MSDFLVRTTHPYIDLYRHDEGLLTSSALTGVGAPGPVVPLSSSSPFMSSSYSSAIVGDMSPMVDKLKTRRGKRGQREAELPRLFVATEKMEVIEVLKLGTLDIIDYAPRYY